MFWKVFHAQTEIKLCIITVSYGIQNFIFNIITLGMYTRLGLTEEETIWLAENHGIRIENDLINISCLNESNIDLIVNAIDAVSRMDFWNFLLFLLIFQFPIFKINILFFYVTNRLKFSDVERETKHTRSSLIKRKPRVFSFLL